MNLQQFYKLDAEMRAQVCIAVLLDGSEAHVFLENDAVAGEQLSGLAESFAGESPEMRTQMLGTLLREALSQLSTK
jgi:hypothetical protein